MVVPPLATWAPGCYGKGAVYADGTMVVWAVDGGIDGTPHHDTVSSLLGRDDRVAAAFWIKPGGEVSVYPDPAFPVVADLAERLCRLHRDLQIVSDDDWDFA